MKFVRARSDDQKERRRAHLLKTARTILRAGTSLHDLGLNALARQADMTKSNVYRYFESREHLLLELLRDEWLAWFDTLTTTWRPAQQASLRALTDHMARTLAAHPLLCELTSALPSVLERNISDEVVLAFKRESLAFFDQCAQFMQQCVPDLTRKAGRQLMHDGAVVVTGLWPLAHPAPSVDRAMKKDPILCAFAHDFAVDLSRLLFAIVLSLKRE